MRRFGAVGSVLALAGVNAALLLGVTDVSEWVGGSLLSLLVVASVFGLGYAFGMTRQP